MNINTEKERLTQTKILEWINQTPQLTEMITVYLSDDQPPHNRGIYCALIPSNQIERVLSDSSWDFSYGEGMPSSVKYHEGEEELVEYLRFGNDEGIEPLVINREFHGMREDYMELCEEFRFFHQLYHDRKQNQYFKFDNDGNENLVAILESNRIQIRLKELRQFLAIKEMHLSIQFDCREHSELSLEELGLNEGGDNQRKDSLCWSHGYGDFGNLGGTIEGHRAFSWLLGKRLIPPLPKSKSGLWGFAEESQKKHIEFIIGADENGDEITNTSNPDALANFFGANPNSPNYLTAVHFRKQVLDKYFQQPSKYSIEDSILRCGNLWSMQLDNHHNDKVCAWLGDLGRDLPYEEQLHWRANNIPPKGGVSSTYFKRQLMAQPADSDRPEHLFKQRYHNLQNSCEEHLGWQLLLPLGTDDEHHFKCMRIPSNNEQRDFDELILGLTKILIDSLNEKQINKLIPTDQQADIKGSIGRFEAALIIRGNDDFADHISFLRKLQGLRSSSAAHRKGSNYQKIANDFGIQNKSLQDTFTGILLRSTDLLDYLIATVRSGKINKS